jgi:hypothetical protein
MDKDEDIFFIHLTSHGARDGELVASFPPMEVETLKPADHPPYGCTRNSELTPHE